MCEFLILILLLLIGIFSGYGIGIRYGFLNTEQDEDDLEDTKVVKFYRNRFINVMISIFSFPICVCILMFFFLVGVCFFPYLLFDSLTPDVIDFIFRCVLALLAGQIVAYGFGMRYNQRHLKK